MPREIKSQTTEEGKVISNILMQNGLSNIFIRHFGRRRNANKKKKSNVYKYKHIKGKCRKLAKAEIDLGRQQYISSIFCGNDVGYDEVW